MKSSKAPIIISVLTFLVFAASIANLVICITQKTSIPMGVGIAVVMAIIFVACLITAIKDMKATKDGSDDDSIDDDDDE